LLIAQIYTRRGEIAAAITELEGFIKVHPDLEMISTVRETIKQLRAP
jgi:hypothetical protein